MVPAPAGAATSTGLGTTSALQSPKPMRCPASTRTRSRRFISALSASSSAFDSCPVRPKASAGTITIGTGAVTTAKLADSSSTTTGVTYAKIQHVTDAKLIGRSAGTNGVAQEITVGSGLSLASGALTNGILRYTTSSKSIPLIASGSQAVQWLTTSTELPSLSVAPQMVRVVLECFTNDGPFVVGNEVDIQSVVMQGFQNNFPIFNYVPTVSSGVVSGSNIFLNVWFSSQTPGNPTPFASASTSRLFVLTSAGAYQELTRASWKVKAYLLYAPTWA